MHTIVSACISTVLSFSCFEVIRALDTLPGVERFALLRCEHELVRRRGLDQASQRDQLMSPFDCSPVQSQNVGWHSDDEAGALRLSISFSFGWLFLPFAATGSFSGMPNRLSKAQTMTEGVWRVM